MDQAVVSYVYTLTKERQKQFEKEASTKNLFMAMLFKIDIEDEAKESEFGFYSLPCFFNHSDFVRHADDGTLVGSVPEKFAAIPYRRFGCTGLFKRNNEIYCGSWNGIYVVDADTLAFKRFISNNLTQDIHGLYIRENGDIITMLASQDTVVITDKYGKMVNGFGINSDLSVYKLSYHNYDYEYSMKRKDFRLANKNRRGACGFWHFNYVQEFGDELWLTSRCINGFVIVNKKTMKARLLTLRLGEEALVHDGIKIDGDYYFTSIGGKIIVAKEFEGNENSGMDTEVYQLSVLDGNNRRMPNWGRGIAVKDDWWYTTLDGRYGQMHNGFRVVRVRKVVFGSCDSKVEYQNLAVIGEGNDFDSITGFDILVK